MVLVGFAGKAGSGKTTAANAMAAITGGISLSFASALKGASLQVWGLKSYFPRFDLSVRSFLQYYGEKAIEKTKSPVWVNLLSVLCDILDDKYEFGFVGDVRHLAEVEFIKRRGGIVIYLSSDEKLPGELGKHPTEHLSPAVCEYEVRQTYGKETLLCVWSLVAGKFKKAIDLITPIRIYLGGSMHSNPNFIKKFLSLRDYLAENYGDDFEFVIPQDVEDYTVWDNLVTSKPYPEACKKLVSNDLGLCNSCYGGLFVLEEPSMGSAFEMASLALQGKPVVVLTPYGNYFHPFLRVFASKVVYTCIEDAVEELSKYFILPSEVLKDGGKTFLQLD